MASRVTRPKSKVPNPHQQDSSSADDPDRRHLPKCPLPWTRIYSLADIQDAELAWSISEYIPIRENRKDEYITDAHGIVRPGQIAAIVGTLGSAVDSMAFILSGGKCKYSGTVSCKPSSVSFIEDIQDFRSVLPSHLTVFEAVDFYLGLCIPSSAGSPDDFDSAAKSCIREFDLLDVQDVECAYLNPTHSKLLYMLSILVNPSPILILHNPERYLEDEHCFVVARRLTAIAAGGHSVLICSTQVSQSFIDICTFMQVFHQSGVVMYSGSPKGFTAFLLTQRIPVNTYSSTSETLFRVVTLKTTILAKMELLIEKPPIPPTLDACQPVLIGGSPAFTLHLLRTIYVLVRDPSLLITRGTVSMALALYCSSIVRVNPDDRLGDLHAATVLDIVLIFLSAVCLVFGYTESRAIDVLLIEESRTIGRFSHPAVILLVRLVTILAMSLCTSFLSALMTLLACNTFVIFSVRSCVLLLSTCAVLYGFVGALCALFKNWSFVFLPLTFIFFLWSMMCTTMPVFEAQSKPPSVWRFTSPLFLIKALVCTDRKDNLGRLFEDRATQDDIGWLIPSMDFRLRRASHVTASIAILIGLLIMMMVAYGTCLHIMLNRYRRIGAKPIRVKPIRKAR